VLDLVGQVGTVHFFDGTDFGKSYLVAEHHIEQLFSCGRSVNQSFVFLAITIPHDDAGFGLGENEVWFAHNGFSLLNVLRKSSDAQCTIRPSYQSLGTWPGQFSIIPTDSEANAIATMHLATFLASSCGAVFLENTIKDFCSNGCKHRFNLVNIL
jgi:hypothetical protein